MNRKKHIYGIGAAMGMLVLILDSKTALAGAREGIELCIRTAIPSLFPFFLLSVVLTSSFVGMRMPLLRPFGKLCGIPPGSESILLTGLLGGYPVGAQAVAQAYSAGQLTRSQANRMLSFCNNAGPSFLFGILAGSFPGLGYAWALWGIHIASAVGVSLILPGEDALPMPSGHQPQFSAQEIMKRALMIMTNVCGWIIGFRVLLAFLSRWIFWALPAWLQVLLSGVLELTNGCCMLAQIENLGLRFILCAGMLTFGGLCVTMQTVSVTGNLSTGHYILGKAAQTVICIALAALCQGFFPDGLHMRIPAVWIAGTAAGISLILIRKRQKKCSNPMTVGV